MNINKVIKRDEKVEYVSTLSYAPFWTAVIAFGVLTAVVIGFVLYLISGFYVTNDGRVTIFVILTVVLDLVAIYKGVKTLCYIWSTKLCVTDKRVVTVTGIMKTSMAELPIEHLSGFEIKQSFLGKIFKYATVGVETSAHTTAARVKYLKNPMELNGISIPENIADRTVSPKKAVQQETPQNASAADEIMKFKRLLDNGVISQEEFETKKKQLLGL